MIGRMHACLAVIQDESMKLFHCWIIFMSSYKELTLSVELMGLYSKISTVYRARLLFGERGRLVIESMKTENSSGPRMEPCGTPEITGQAFDVTPSATTLGAF